MGEIADALSTARTFAEGGGPAAVLAPASERGWFGGTGLVAHGGQVVDGVSVAEAASALDDAFAGRTAPAAALLGYEGEARVVRFEHAEPVSRGSLLSALGPIARAPDAPLMDAIESDMDGATYRQRVDAVRELIAAGDVYVLNLTRRLTGLPGLAPFEAFATLLPRARSDMSALLVAGDTALASVSPERFLRVTASPEATIVEVCPIKGTRPRGDDAESDAALARELLEDAKELAEHLMVVDLERNDLGRVSAPGTIEVAPLYEVIATAYCHQLVSTVRGTLREGTCLAEVLEAAFPCGSVTGAPKLAAMRIAAELEASPRGAYCGALAVAVPGRLDSSVLIRTLEYRADGSAAWGTGCGITIDSDPVAEWLESELKAAPMRGGTARPIAERHVAGAVPR